MREVLVTAKSSPTLDAQLEMQLPEKYRHRLLMARKIEAAQQLVAIKTLKVVANDLDSIWGPDHPVSASTLGNALRDHERSYWRSEWDSYFCDVSDEFREVCAEMARCGRRARTPEEVLEELKDLVRNELAPKKAADLIRKAEGR